MKANNRLACSVRNTSAIRLQATETTNRLNTDNQTKNTRAVQTLSGAMANSPAKTSMSSAKKP